MNVSDPILAQTLDREAIAAGGYWTVDYVVYDDAQTLQRLLDSIRAGGTLQSCGWTNLCPNPLTLGDVNVVNKNDPAATTLTADLPSEARNIVNQGARVLSMTAVLNDDSSDSAGPSPEKQQAVRDEIEQTVKEGASEGVLEPERLLASVRLLPKLGSLGGVTPSRESAAQLAEQAHASWTIIYTLRRSPVPMVSIRLPHRPDPAPPGTEPALDDPIVQDLETLGSNRFEFTPAELDAHNQAAQNWLTQQAEKN